MNINDWLGKSSTHVQRAFVFMKKYPSITGNAALRLAELSKSYGDREGLRLAKETIEQSQDVIEILKSLIDDCAELIECQRDEIQKQLDSLQ